MHGSQIVLGVLKIILRRNPVAAQGFGTRQRQITLVVSLGVLGIRAVESGRFGFADSRFSRGSHIRTPLRCRYLELSVSGSRGLEPCHVISKSPDAVGATW